MKKLIVLLVTIVLFLPSFTLAADKETMFEVDVTIKYNSIAAEKVDDLISAIITQSQDACKLEIKMKQIQGSSYHIILSE